MMLLFAGIPFIASFTVNPPQYNFVYSSKDYQINEKLGVKDGKLVLSFYNKSSASLEAPSLYLFDVHSKGVTKLNYDLSKGETLFVKPHQSRSFRVEGISLKALDRSKIAPDGYQLMKGENNYVLGALFGGSGRDFVSISKLGRVEKFPSPPEEYWSLEFEGWIISE